MLKTTQGLLNNPATHNFTKTIIREALSRDLLDAYYDIQEALWAVKKELDAQNGELQQKLLRPIGQLNAITDLRE